MIALRFQIQRAARLARLSDTELNMMFGSQRLGAKKMVKRQHAVYLRRR